MEVVRYEVTRYDSGTVGLDVYKRQRYGSSHIPSSAFSEGAQSASSRQEINNFFIFKFLDELCHIRLIFFRAAYLPISSMRRIEPSAFRRISSSRTTSGDSSSNARYILSSVTIFMNAQLLHPQEASSGGAGMKVFPGFSFRIWYNMPRCV